MYVPQVQGIVADRVTKDVAVVHWTGHVTLHGTKNVLQLVTCGYMYVCMYMRSFVYTSLAIPVQLQHLHSGDHVQ